MNAESKKAKAIYSGSFNCTIYYEDTDLSAFVYHANYLKFFERARTELIGAQRLANWFKEGKHFVVAKAEIDFMKAAQLGDRLNIQTQVYLDGPASLVAFQTAYSDSLGTQKMVEATLKLICLNAKNKASRLPKELLTQSENSI